MRDNVMAASDCVSWEAGVRPKAGRRWINAGRLTSETSPHYTLYAMPRVWTLSMLCLGLAFLSPLSALAQIKAELPPDIKPAWDKGIQPINRDNYWNAVECGKQGGQNPPCVFYDTGLCKNADFALALYTPYKMVAYEVWRVVRQRQPAPTPSYQEAQRTRITVGIKPVAGSKNPISSMAIKRGGRVVKPVSQTIDPGDARFTFDYPAFAATEDITIDLVGRVATRSCVVEQPVLARFR
jgi:hypothetical protein